MHTNNTRSYIFIFSFILSLTIIPVTSLAATTIPNAMTISGSVVWDKAGSPYILEGLVNVSQGGHLTIDPGTSVRSDINADIAEISVNGGSLVMNGKSDRVNIQGLNDIFVVSGKVDIFGADISTTYGLGLVRSTANIASSTFESGDDAVVIDKSIVNIKDSEIINNKRGITVRSSNPIFVADNQIRYGIGGIGNVSDAPSDTDVNISNTALVGNVEYAVFNMSTSTVIAENNWWGDATGPSFTGQNSINGYIDADPWLKTRPEFVEDKVCCSSVLFLPGIESSYLYEPSNSLLGKIMPANTLWPPNRNDDVRKLFMNTDGSSVNKDIYSGGAVGSVFGLYHVYDKFIGYMNDLVSNKKINEWKAFGYDWRKPIADIVNGKEQKATTTDDLIRSVESLANDSQTHKVTVIAHSNGGLVAKYLVKKLSEIGKDNLIDSVISVAVPYLGTPQAIAGILYGDEQEIAKGIILKQSVAREMGRNMPSAYSLLPSERYFDSVSTPAITFASSTIPGINNGSYQLAISDGSSLASFIIDDARARVEPKLSDTKNPIVGNGLLMNAAEALHAILDPFTWPTSIARLSIIGWNMLTTKGVDYYTNETDKKVSNMGDGTVVAKSAAYDSGKAVSIDLAETTKNDKTNIDHVDIMNSSSTQSVIDKSLKGTNPDSFCNDIENIPGVTCGEPDYSKEIYPAEIVISAHSPVYLAVYDEAGNKTGFLPPPPGVEEGLFRFCDTGILTSRCWTQDKTDSDDYDQYIGLEDGGQRYTIVATGKGVGTMTLDIERDVGGHRMDIVEYINVPVNEKTVASTTIQLEPLPIYKTMPDKNASNTPSLILPKAKPLLIDRNADGKPDNSVMPKRPDRVVVSSITAEQTIKYLSDLFGRGPHVTQIIKRITNLNRSDAEGRIIDLVKIDRQIRDIISKLYKNKSNQLSESQKESVLAVIDKLLEKYQ
ncbi:MAG: hypothetical protein M1459_02365 [Patescibacteria group bacterium]|nr:hypothetical protein [Patescibacteria group bacterium]